MNSQQQLKHLNICSASRRYGEGRGGEIAGLKRRGKEEPQTKCYFWAPMYSVTQPLRLI